jgi:hypothetical protein
MKNSLFNRAVIILFILAIGISSRGQKPGFTFDQAGRWAPVFPVDFDKALYKATFDISKNHLTGLVFFKQTSDTSFRVIFSSETGMTYFDLELLEKRMNVMSVFPQMDRKPLLRILENDFRMILFRDRTISSMDTEERCPSDSTILHRVVSKRGKYRYTVNCSDLVLKGIESIGKSIGKTRLDFSPPVTGVPGNIRIQNPAIGLDFRMILISR